MNTLALVLCHGGAHDTVERHRHHWEDLSEQVIYSVPSDDPLKDFTGHQFVWGVSSKYAATTNTRTRAALEYAMSMPGKWTHLWFYEYDAVCFEHPPKDCWPQSDQLFASRFDNYDPEFKGSFYLHSPILLGRKALSALVAEMKKLPDDAERGFGDRYFGLAADRAGIPVIDALKKGFAMSKNHIHPEDLETFTLGYRCGARMSHGIKDEETLLALEAAVLGGGE